MRRVLVAGFVLAVLAAVSVWIGNLFSIGLGSTLFAGTIGAVLGLVKSHTPIIKIVSFLIGFVVAWALYGVQALLLPLTSTGEMVGVFLTIAVVTIIAALAHSKLPFWAMLLGVAAMAGAYGTSFLSAPQNFISQSVAAAGATLFVAALGMIAAALTELVPSSSDPDEPALQSSDTDNAGADILTSTKG